MPIRLVVMGLKRESVERQAQVHKGCHVTGVLLLNSVCLAQPLQGSCVPKRGGDGLNPRMGALSVDEDKG